MGASVAPSSDVNVTAPVPVTVAQSGAVQTAWPPELELDASSPLEPEDSAPVEFDVSAPPEDDPSPVLVPPEVVSRPVDDEV